jgi:hypothetical protein
MKNNSLKPFDITFTINSIEEAKMLLFLFESSPSIFAPVIDEIKNKIKDYQGESVIK